MLGTISYSGKVAVVTGASRGIGRSVTELLAKKGCHVAAVARPSALLQQTVAQLTEKATQHGCLPVI